MKTSQEIQKEQKCCLRWWGANALRGTGAVSRERLTRGHLGEGGKELQMEGIKENVPFSFF